MASRGFGWFGFGGTTCVGSGTFGFGWAASGGFG
jgi:hypothetical protein